MEGGKSVQCVLGQCVFSLEVVFHGADAPLFE